jgi:hypothetical protein
LRTARQDSAIVACLSGKRRDQRSAPVVVVPTAGEWNGDISLPWVPGTAALRDRNPRLSERTREQPTLPRSSITSPRLACRPITRLFGSRIADFEGTGKRLWNCGSTHVPTARAPGNNPQLWARGEMRLSFFALGPRR